MAAWALSMALGKSCGAIGTAQRVCGIFATVKCGFWALMLHLVHSEFIFHSLTEFLLMSVYSFPPPQ